MHARATLPPELLTTARAQHGLLSTGQLRATLPEGQYRSLVRSGVLERSGRSVYRLIGAPATFPQRVMGAVLSVGPPVAASHGTAARLWGFAELGAGPITVAVGPERSGRDDGVRVRRLRMLDGDVSHRLGVPVTTPVRTLLDLSTGPWDGRLLDRFVDDLLRNGHMSVRDLAAGINRYARLRGAPALRRVAEAHLEGLQAGDRAAGSQWEQVIRRWLADDGFPTVPQHPVVVGSGTYWLDLAMPDYLVAVEFDGFAHHRGRRSFDDDRRRWSELQLAGWIVIPVTSRHSRAEIVGRVRRAVELRRSEG